MPTIYLSPSTQEANLYVTGGSEEYYMNLIADAMLPYLRSNGITYTRNTKTMSAADAIAQSNMGRYDLHLALHSNAAPEGQYGEYRGIDAYYAQGSRLGKQAADIFAQNLKSIYPLPSKVRAIPTTTIGEVIKTKAPSVFLELGYHDNIDDATWITQNIESIAANLVLSLTEYFGIPFVQPRPAKRARVSITRGTLNLRKKPSTNSVILASMPNNAPLTVLGQWRDWYVVNYNGITGYALSRYVTID